MNKNKIKQKKTKSQCSSVQATDGSIYECEICLRADNANKVRCDDCQMWYHFECVNVTGEALEKMERWACITCEGKNKKESTPKQSNTENVTNLPIPNEGNDKSDTVHQPIPGQVGQVTPSQVFPDQPNVDPVNPPVSETGAEKPNKSQKSVSISSNVSRRTALALQRLEEEKKLSEQREREDQERRDKRDQEYLNKKYSILVEESDDEISITDEEQDRFTRERIQQWSESLAHADSPIVIGLSEMGLISTDPALRSMVTVENSADQQQQSSNVGNVGTFAKNFDKGQEKNSRLRSNASIKKAKFANPTLPLWLTAPKKSIPHSLPWKVSSGVSTTAAIRTSAVISAVTSSSPINNDPALVSQALNSDTQRCSIDMESHTQPMSSKTSVQLPSKNGQLNAFAGQVPTTMNSQRNNEASANQNFYFGLRPTTADNNFLSSIGPSSAFTSSNIPQFNRKASTSISGIMPNNQPIMSNSSICAKFPAFTPVTANYNFPVMSTNQPSKFNEHPTSSGSTGNQTFYFGLRPTISNNITNSNAQQSIVVSTGGSQFNTIVTSSMYGNKNPVSQAVFSGYGQGASGTTDNNPITSRIISNVSNVQSHIVSSMQSSNANVPPYYSSVSHSNSSLFGHTNFGNRSYESNNNMNQNTGSENVILTGAMTSNINANGFKQTSHTHQPFVPNSNINQNVSSGNTIPIGAIPAALNVSTTSTYRARLTTEQIAARHVIPKLPKFYGDPKYWQAFISAFEYSTDECGFTNVENLGRLQESLKGDAFDAVGSRLLHPNSVPAVMNTLKMMYGRPELIIESIIENIKKEPSPKDDDLAALIKFAIAVQNLCGSIQETGATEHLRNPTLMNAIIDKLPTQVQLNWAYYKHSIGIVDLSNLGDWLYGLADVASQVVRKSTPKSGKKKDNDKTNNSNANSNRYNYLNTQVENRSKRDDSKSANQKKTNKCLACQLESCSKISTCTQFKNWSRTERWTFVKQNKLCARCLGAHSFYRCRSEQSCKAAGCTKRHHTLLHDNGRPAEKSKNEKKSSIPENKSTDSENRISTSVCNSQQSKDNRTDIFRIVPIVLRNKKKVIRDFAYLDDGSNLTLMEEGLANELELVGTPEVVCIDWAFGQSHESEESRIVTTKIARFYHQAPSFKLENVRTVKDLHLPTQSLTSTCFERYPHLKNLPIATYETAKPRMLIGLQYSKLTVSLETIEGEWEEPIACRTRLGWVLQGPSYDNNNHQPQKKFSLNLCHCQSRDNQLHKLVKEYFSVENFGVKISDKILESKQIQRARYILESTTVKKDGHYESGLLWKYDQIDLPDSYNMALKRLQCLESKMEKNPQLADNLCNQIEQFMVKGYIKKLSPKELEIRNDRVWYLPIFPVFNPKKPESKELFGMPPLK